MEWLDITSVFAILAYVTIAILFVLRSKKEKNPQNYVRMHLLIIELWILSIFVVMAMRKITILIAW